MTFSLWSFLIAAVFNGFAAYAALIRGSVSFSGAVAGTIVGAGILSAGGFFLWAILIIFFVSSSLLSRIGKARKAALEIIHKKGSERDAVQVFANGGIGFAGALLFGFTGNELFWCAAAASLAAAAADTWASELGVLSKRPPVSIKNFKTIVPGVSGGVSWLGTSAAFGGAALVGLIFGFGAMFIMGVSLELLWGMLAVTLCGFTASFVDSILGATLQIHYYDEKEQSITEFSVKDGIPMKYYQGIRWIDNDAVNFISTLFAAMTAGLIHYLLI